MQLLPFLFSSGAGKAVAYLNVCRRSDRGDPVAGAGLESAGSHSVFQVDLANNLLIPYCYGYCYWERHGVHPFGEREHGGAGIVRFYVESSA